MKLKKILLTVIHYALVALSLVVILFPAYWLFSISFKTELEVYEWPPIMIPRSLTLRNFETAFRGYPILDCLRNSLIIALGCTAPSILAGTMAAYAISRWKVGGDKTRNFIVFVRMAPGVVTIIPYFIIMQFLNLLNTTLGVITAHASFILPFAAWLMIGFVEDVPKALDESAKLDGASNFGIFWRILLPNIYPGLIATSILCMIFSWNDFFFAYFLTYNPESSTITALEASYRSSTGIRWTVLGVTTLLASLPILTIALSVQKYLYRGFSLAGVAK